MKEFFIIIFIGLLFSAFVVWNICEDRDSWSNLAMEERACRIRLQRHIEIGRMSISTYTVYSQYVKTHMCIKNPYDYGCPCETLVDNSDGLAEYFK
jgi:hypothetical protein